MAPLRRLSTTPSLSKYIIVGVPRTLYRSNVVMSPGLPAEYVSTGIPSSFATILSSSPRVLHGTHVGDVKYRILFIYYFSCVPRTPRRLRFSVLTLMDDRAANR